MLRSGCVAAVFLIMVPSVAAAENNVRPGGSTDPERCQGAWDDYDECMSSATYDDGSESWYGYPTKSGYCFNKSNRQTYCTAKGDSSSSDDSSSASSSSSSSGSSGGGSTGGAAGAGAAAGAAPLAAPLLIGDDEEERCDPTRTSPLVSYGLPLLTGALFTLVPALLPEAGWTPLYEGPWAGWGPQFLEAMSLRSMIGYQVWGYEGGETVGLSSELTVNMLGLFKFGLRTAGMRGGDDGVNHEEQSVDLNTLGVSAGFQYGTGLLSPFVDIGFESEVIDQGCRDCDSFMVWRVGNTAHFAPLYDAHKGLVIETALIRFVGADEYDLREFEWGFFLGLGLESWLFM